MANKVISKKGRKGKIISDEAGHWSIDTTRICKVCKTHPTMLCDGGHETCTNDNCPTNKKQLP